MVENTHLLRKIMVIIANIFETLTKIITLILMITTFSGSIKNETRTINDIYSFILHKNPTQ